MTAPPPNPPEPPPPPPPPPEFTSREWQPPLAPAEAQRFKERTAAERVNSRLKERYDGRWVRVRGASKVGCHLAFGLLALTAAALLTRVC